MQPQNTPELIDWINVRFTSDEQKCLMICASPILASVLAGYGYSSEHLDLASPAKVGTLKACADIPIYSCKLEHRAIVIVNKYNPKYVFQAFRY